VSLFQKFNRKNIFDRFLNDFKLPNVIFHQTFFLMFSCILTNFSFHFSIKSFFLNVYEKNQIFY
jgi:hypothetical protein